MWEEAYRADHTYRWAVVYHDTAIGVIDVRRLTCVILAYMGWMLDNIHWNKGIMTEAATTAVRDYLLFEKVLVDAFMLRMQRKISGSGRVMQKIGMKLPVSCEEYFAVCDKEPKHELNGMPAGHSIKWTEIRLGTELK